MAKILGIESASLTASVAIAEGDILLAEYTVNYKKTHSQTLLPMIDEIITMTETDKQSIDAIGKTAGGRSYPGCDGLSYFRFPQSGLPADGCQKKSGIYGYLQK